SGGRLSAIRFGGNKKPPPREHEDGQMHMHAFPRYHLGWPHSMRPTRFALYREHPAGLLDREKRRSAQLLRSEFARCRIKGPSSHEARLWSIRRVADDCLHQRIEGRIRHPRQPRKQQAASNLACKHPEGIQLLDHVAGFGATCIERRLVVDHVAGFDAESAPKPSQRSIT
ncbi:MAG: hypothetical protein ACOX69_08100, partial [Coriobacteriales bacterium]